MLCTTFVLISINTILAGKKIYAKPISLHNFQPFFHVKIVKQFPYILYAFRFLISRQKNSLQYLQRVFYLNHFVLFYNSNSLTRSSIIIWTCLNTCLLTAGMNNLSTTNINCNVTNAATILIE